MDEIDTTLPAKAGLPGLRVARSKVHGYGVFTRRAFREGEVIAEVDGVALRADEIADDTYCLWVREGLLYDMVDQTRWINHSCEPNVSVRVGESGGEVSAHFVALRDIAAGEELFYDYAFAPEYAIPCHCGSRLCRGTIVYTET